MFLLFYEACKNGYKQIAEILIENGAKLDSKKANGQTPLHLGVCLF